MNTLIRLTTWELHSPAHQSACGDAWLRELAEMRGRVLYGLSGCAKFQLPDGTFTDSDGLDAHCYHLFARCGGKLVGCCRAIHLHGAPSSVAESLLGRPGLERLLSNREAAHERTAEVSRWLVVPEYRNTPVATRLILGMWAAIRSLGAWHALGMAGTRDGQDQMLMRFGGRRVPGFEPILSPQFAQNVVPIWFELSCPPPRWATLVDQMADRLGLADWRHSAKPAGSGQPRGPEFGHGRRRLALPIPSLRLYTSVASDNT